MYSRKILRFLTTKNIRKFSNKIKPKVEANSDVVQNIESGLFKPRLHPGVFKPRTITLPADLIDAIQKALIDYPVKQILTDSKILARYLRARHPPIEESYYLEKKREVTNKVLSAKADLDEINDEERKNLKDRYKSKIEFELKSKLYQWKPIEYTITTALQYLLGRAAPEYAVLVRVFQEIQQRDPQFKPKSFFDFGSGVGSGAWAAKLFWQRSIFEYFNVDTSVNMNDLALILLKGGTGASEPNIKGVFYRQFLPATNTSYDLVLSAYTLLELPSSQSRLEAILKLWNKTENYLVIIEQGTNAGFKIVNEARDFILDIKEHRNKGHVFAPCPHDEVCPRFLTDTTPCNFDIAYNTIPIGQNSVLDREKFCFVVLKKGERNLNSNRWPRIVRPTLVRSKHAICRMCTAEGKLEEVIFTAAKHGKTTYRCAKVTRWGDLLPIKVESVDASNNEENK